MVVKSATENKTSFNTLLSTVTAPGNDVLSARIAIIQKNLMKKQETPRYSGGIWDIDDKMDTTESPDVANRDKVRLQLKTLLQSESPYFEIDDNGMDTIETCSSENLSFLSPSFLVVPGEVPKKEPENLKKKSMGELSLERSKRCRTSSKTEVYPLEYSFGVNNLLTPTLDKNSPAKCKESQIDINDNNMQKDGFELIIKTPNSYQNEIDVLQKVALILESHNINDVENKSYLEEVEQLQKICLVLKNLGKISQPVSNATLDVNKSVTGGELAGAFTCNDIHHNEYQSKVLPNLVKDNLQPSISEDIGSTIQVPCASESPKVEKGKLKSYDSSVDGNKKSDPVSVNNAVVPDEGSETGANCSENQSSWLEQIVNGTLPWKPIGRPPPASAFSVRSVQSTKVPNVLNSSIISANEMLQSKANPEKSRGRAMETDDILEILKNAASRGSPPPMAAFSKSAATSPSRTVDKSSSKTTRDTPLQTEASVDTILSPGISNKKEKDDLVAVLDEASLIFPKQNAAIEKNFDKSRNGNVSTCEIAKVSLNDAKERGKHDEQIGEATTVKPLKLDNILPLHTRVSTSKSVLELNSANSVLSFKAKTHQNRYLRSSTENPDSYSPYQANKESKSTEIKEPLIGNVTMIKDAVQPSPPKYVPPHLRSSSNNNISKNSQESQGFKPELKTSQNHLKSSSKTRDAYSPYQTKERKGTEIRDQLKSNVTTNASRNQAQGFRTKAWSAWRKDDSPPKQNNLSSSPARHKTVDDKYTNDEKVPNLNVKMDSSSSGSNPSECFDSSKLNRAANQSRPPSDRKVLNVDVKKENSVYGASEDAIISLKIFDEKNIVVDELTLPLNQIVQKRKMFPSLSEVVPNTLEKDKVLMLSGNAVQVFLRCVFTASELRIPSWEIALEAYYLAKTYGIAKLQDQCKQYFNFKAIQSSQVQGIIQIARKFQITDALKNSIMFAEVQAHNISGSTMPTIKEQKCTVSCMVYADPFEYIVPLLYVKETGLGSSIESDITNDIIFESKSGTFCLTGLQIKLEAEKKDFQKEVSIFCDVHKSNKKVFELERLKPLNKLLIIHFKQRLLVEPGESAKISVVIEDACMRMCHCLTKEREIGRCADGSFEISFQSDRKSEARQPLFFLEKLLYTFMGRKN